MLWLCLIALASFSPQTPRAPLAVQAQRTAADVLNEIAELRKEQVAARAREDFKAEHLRLTGLLVERVSELWALDAQHAELKSLLPERWMLLATVLDRPGEADSEIGKFLEGAPEAELAATARFHRSKVRLMLARESKEKRDQRVAAAREAVSDVAKHHGTDPRLPDLLNELAELMWDDPKGQVELFRKVVDGFPDHKRAKTARTKLAQLARVGQPFTLAFEDATSGVKVDLADLKGKVVVIDFWATWCGPCVRDMPTMKRLNAEWKSKGVEFIGVSLDKKPEEGGLEALKAYVQREGIAWPQYYQGNHWESEFSRSWGVNSIPCIFLVDRQGNLFTTQASGKLEDLLPKLLAAR